MLPFKSKFRFSCAYFITHHILDVVHFIIANIEIVMDFLRLGSDSFQFFSLFDSVRTGPKNRFTHTHKNRSNFQTVHMF